MAYHRTGASRKRKGVEVNPNEPRIMQTLVELGKETRRLAEAIREKLAAEIKAAEEKNKEQK